MGSHVVDTELYLVVVIFWHLISSRPFFGENKNLYPDMFWGQIMATSPDLTPKGS